MNGCPAGKFSHNGVCQPCHDFCETCNGEGNSKCQSCKDTYFLKGTTCDSSCGEGYFGYDKECYTCASGCATCNGELDVECEVCKDTFKMVAQKCVEVVCLPTQYRQHIDCFDCNSACDGCTGSGDTKCVKCSKGHLLREGKWVSWVLTNSLTIII
jgi:proprotein convertase subtilisin/kexin type 5